MDPELLKIIIWPIIVLAFLVIFIFVFRKPIINKLNKLEKTKFPGGEAEFGGGDNRGGGIKQNNQFAEEYKEPLEQSVEPEKEKSGEESNSESEEEKDWIHYYINSDYKKARELVEIEIIKTQDIDKAKRLRGFSADILGYIDFNKARDEFKALIAEYPKHEWFYILFSSLYTRKNLQEESLSILDDGIKKTEKYESLLLQKGKILEYYQHYEESKNIANGIIKLEGIDSSILGQAYCLLGRIQVKLTNTDEASSNYIKAYRQCPSDTEIISEIAKYFLGIEKYKVEVFFRRKLLEIDSENSEYWALIGNCYLVLGLSDLAMNAYEKANTLTEEGVSWILSNIGNLFNNLRLYSNAIFYLSQATDLNPSGKYAHERLASALDNKNKEIEKENEILLAVHNEINELTISNPISSNNTDKD